MERLLAAAWKQILGVPQVGAHDNFFDLGGDSILSLLVVSQVAKAGVEVTPRQFFEHQTVATLARVATRAGARRAGPATRPRATRIDTTTAGRVLDLLRAADQTMGDRDDQRD
jgi:aryl carrier-like protein